MATYLGAEYQVLTTAMTGVPYAEIANAAINFVTWELNGWGEVQFTLPVTDAQAYTELRKDYQTRREVQIWRNGKLIWWGVYVAGDADDKLVTFTCYGLLWYFARRYFGPVHSNTMPQLITNGNMESTPLSAAWSFSAGATVTSETGIRRSGSRSMKIVTSSAAGVENYAVQGVSIPTPARRKPLLFTLSGWLYVSSLTRSHPFDLAMALGPSGSSSLGGARVKPDIPFGVWNYYECQFLNPALATTGLSAVAYVPTAATVYWDDVRVTYEQRTGAIEGEDWSGQYLRRLFNYGAGINGGGSGGALSPFDETSWWGAPVNKSSLNMTWNGVTGLPGTPLGDRYWDHADEANIFAAMLELPARNIVDFEVTWPTDGRSRVFTSWGPRKGSTKTGLAAEAGRNILRFRYTVDGRRRSNDVRVKSRSPGAVPEVGQGGGPTVADGPQLEAIVTPPFEIDGNLLIETATAELARTTEPVSVPTITVAAGLYMGDIQPGGTAEAGAPLTVGDSIPVRIDHGWVQEAATRRVVKMTLRPPTEELDIVFNEA